MGWLGDLPPFDDIVHTFSDGQQRQLPTETYRDTYRRANVHFRRYQVAVATGALLLTGAVTALLRKHRSRR